MQTLPQKFLGLLGFRPSIAQRLLEACAAVPPIVKKGEADQFNYLRILDLANALRGELSSRGLILIPNDLECEEKRFKSDIPGRYYTEARVKTEFTVTDGRSRESFSSYGSGRDMDGFALSIAQTMAIKSWLKRLGLIFGEKDDAEIEQSAAPLARVAKANTPREAERLDQYKERAWAEAIVKCGMTREQIEKHLSKNFGFPVKSADIIALPPEQFDLAIRLLNTSEDLREALELSTFLEEKKKTGPQAVTKVLDRRAKDEVAGD